MYNSRMGFPIAWRITLYNLGLLALAVPGLLLAALQIAFVPRRRVGLLRRLAGAAPREAGRVVWVHAVSVGEVKSVAPLLSLLRRDLPGDVRLFLSTTTSTGRETALRECAGADEIFYFPLDHPAAVRRALGRVKPVLFAAAETELWPNFLAACFGRGIPVVVVNGRISDRSYPRYLAFRWFLSPFLARVRAFLMQGPGDACRIETMGAPPERVSVSGNTKYDRPPATVELPGNVISWCAGGPVLAAGSTHRGEEKALLGLLGKPGLQARGMRLVLAPRHPRRFDEVAALLRAEGVPYSRFSGLGPEGPGGRVLLVDAMGLLDSFYALAAVCFVGGSLVPVGGHNLLEPAMLGKPVLTGPHLENFRDIARDLIDAGGARVVRDEASLADAVSLLLENPGEREAMGGRALAASRRATGASERCAAVVRSLLEAGR